MFRCLYCEKSTLRIFRQPKMFMGWPVCGRDECRLSAWRAYFKIVGP